MGIYLERENKSQQITKLKAEKQFEHHKIRTNKVVFLSINYLKHFYNTSPHPHIFLATYSLIDS